MVNLSAYPMQPRSLLASGSHDSRDYTDRSGKNMDPQTLGRKRTI